MRCDESPVEKVITPGRCQYNEAETTVEVETTTSFSQIIQSYPHVEVLFVRPN